jgi:hypothetical protein
MQGVCSSHWLEADEAAHGADRLEAELSAIRAEEAEEAERRRQLVTAAASRRNQLHGHDHAQRILEAIITRFYTDAAQGGRNNALAGAAWAAGRLVAGGELAEKPAAERLVTEGVAAGLPWREARDVVRGQFRHATKNPRVLERRSEWTPSWKVAW